MAKNRVIISPRDESLLRLLSRTVVTKHLVLKANPLFDEPFLNERRVRERMQVLQQAGLVKSFSTGAIGSLLQYFKLTPEGFRQLHGDRVKLPPRSFFTEVALSRFQHTLVLAEVVIHAMVAAHESRIQIANFHRENELVLQSGQQRQVPDCHFHFEAAGRHFHVLFEIDNSTEPLDSFSHQSIKNKLLGYDAYQDALLAGWAKSGRATKRPAFRVIFLTRTQDRCDHILSLAATLIRNKDRRLFYGATQADFLSERDALRQPVFLDHQGAWQALINLQPTATSLKSPARLRLPVALPLFP